VPEPFKVWLSDNVGLEVLLQHMPLSVTGVPPSDVTSPPPLADTWLMN